MKQKGWKVNSSTLIDDLSYTYNSASSNKLQNVIDGQNDTQTKLGDFRSSDTYMNSLGGGKTASAQDYKLGNCLSQPTSKRRVFLFEGTDYSGLRW